MTIFRNKFYKNDTNNDEQVGYF